MTSPNLTNVVWVKTILYSYRHIRPKKVKYPIPEIPDDSENKSGMDWVLPKIIGSGRVSGTRQALGISPGSFKNQKTPGLIGLSGHISQLIIHLV